MDNKIELVFAGLVGFTRVDSLLCGLVSETMMKVGCVAGGAGFQQTLYVKPLVQGLHLGTLALPQYEGPSQISRKMYI